MENKQLKDLEVSFFRNYKEYYKNIPFVQIIQQIKNGYWKADIEKIRKLKQEGKDEWQEIKKMLPAFTHSGIFKNGHKIQNLVEYSKLLVLDFDHVNKSLFDVSILKARECQFTFAGFKSPGGEGFKIFVKVDSAKEGHPAAFRQVVDYYQDLLELRVDIACKDLSRLCFISYDPDAYVNEHTKIFPVTIDKPADGLIEADEDGLFQEIVKYNNNISTYHEGRNTYVHRLFCNFNRFGIAPEVAFAKVLESEFNTPDFTDEITTCFTSGYENEHERGKYPLSWLGFRTDKSNTLPVSEFAALPDDASQNPYFPESIFEKLPPLIKDSVNLFVDRRQKDLFLTGAIGVLSGCFPTISGIYYNDKVYPNMFVFITAPPASGKGALKYTQYYALDYHKSVLAKTDDDEGPKKVVFIPSNSSASSIISLLNANEGSGIFFDSEADTLSNAINSEWGNFSDLLRKAFHHETYEQSRKEKNSYISITKPKLSVVLSGTPGQIGSLTKSVEDGLFSRITFYAFRSEPVWDDVTPIKRDYTFETHFDLLAKKTFHLIQYCLNKGNVTFELLNHHWKALNDKQREALPENIEFGGEGTVGLTKRIGIMWFRIAMILSTIRYASSKEEGNKIICNDVDFEIATEMMNVLREHILSVYRSLSKHPGGLPELKINLFYKKLPEQFKRAEAVKIGDTIGLTNDQVGKYLSKLKAQMKLADGERYSYYIKVNGKPSGKPAK